MYMCGTCGNTSGHCDTCCKCGTTMYETEQPAASGVVVPIHYKGMRIMYKATGVYKTLFGTEICV